MSQVLDNNLPNVTDLKVKYLGLKARIVSVSESLQAAIPLAGCSKAAQEAFLLTLSDAQLLEHICKTVESMFRGIGFSQVSPEALEQNDDFVASLAELASELIQALEEQFGIANEVVIPTMIKDLVRQIDLIETVVTRSETSSRAMGV